MSNLGQVLNTHLFPEHWPFSSLQYYTTVYKEASLKKAKARINLLMINAFT